MRPPPESDAELACATIGGARLAMLRNQIAAGTSEVIFVELSTEDLGLELSVSSSPTCRSLSTIIGIRFRRALHQLLELVS
jgi:hypothetical protein